MGGTNDDEEMERMPIKIRSDPSQDSYEVEIIPAERVNNIYDFYMTTNGQILILCLVCVVLFIQYATNTHGIVFNRFFQYNAIINSNPNNLRDLIREASINAKKSGAISTIPIDRYEVINEKGFQFVISVANMASKTKDKVATLPGASEDGGVAADVFSDPLDVNHANPALVVLNYEESFKRPYSILLNKFNTISDHCLLVTNDFQPQITPLTGSDLSLLYSILYQTSGVGFYNSNVLAGASQKHKHMQFIPMDETWQYRSVDAPYGIPLDDFIMPSIENGHYKTIHCYEHRLGKQYRDDVYHVPQFGFQHGIAVLKVSGEFATVEDHANYLQCVYETLLTINEIAVESLQQCAAEAVAAEKGESEAASDRRTRTLTSSSVGGGGGAKVDRIHKEATLARNKIAYGQHRQHTGSSKSNGNGGNNNTTAASVVRSLAAGEGEEPTFADILVEPAAKVDCEREVSYNLIMTSSYMMVVPRSEKSFNDVVTVNSFGFMGFMMASNKQKLEVIRSEGPLSVLKGVSQPKKYHGYHDLHQHQQ